jgi:hypothetical protein
MSSLPKYSLHTQPDALALPIRGRGRPSPDALAEVRPAAMAPAVTPCPGPGACELAREELALCERDLLERVAVLERDRDAYRALALAKLDRLHDLSVQVGRDDRLAEEYRYLREQMMGADL